MDLELLLSALTAKDTKCAYGTLLELERLSDESDCLYPYTERFADMTEDRAYAVRCRGFRLFCRQARWDDGGVIDRCLDRALAILEDEKPTAVRQALAALLELAPYKRALWPVIRARVEAMDLNRYRDTMAPLIEKDIRRLLDAME
ncbi:SufBD protein [Dysosmobacter sp. HCP28S3_G4]|uniref:SufBD protein n=1 Tax=Dysosmobacter sp. HCP28S3_G4 TaxID=3438938 RepID=UPI003F8CB5D7